MGDSKVQFVFDEFIYNQTSIQRTSPSDPFCSLYRIIHYIKCKMLNKSSKRELGLVHYISELFKKNYFTNAQLQKVYHCIGQFSCIGKLSKMQGLTVNWIQHHLCTCTWYQCGISFYNSLDC